MQRHCFLTLSCKVSSHNLDVHKWLAFGGDSKQLVQWFPSIFYLEKVISTLGAGGEHMSKKLLLWSRQINLSDGMSGWHMYTNHTLGCPMFTLESTKAAFIRNVSDFSWNGVKITTPPQNSITTNYLMQNKNRMKIPMWHWWYHKHSTVTKIFKRLQDSISSPL